MKKFIFPLTILFFILVSCGSGTQNNTDNQTHTHSDGTEHSHSDKDDHEHEVIPEGQESFEVEEKVDGHQHDHDTIHNHDHDHEHPHKH